MDYSFENQDGIVILNVKGNVLVGTYNEEILEQVSEYISNGKDKMVIHLGESKFINSNGLNLLLNVLTKCRKSGGEVILANVPEELSKLLIITKLDAIFQKRETTTEAVDALKNS